MTGCGTNVIAFQSRPDARGRALPPWERDPRRFPYGLLIVDPWPIGSVASGFCWFASEGSAAEFLRNGLWEVLTDERMGPFAGVRELYQEALSRRSDISPAWVDAVSALQDHVMVMWFGTFESLLRGDDVMVRCIVREYRAEAGLAEAAPLEVAPLLAYLRQYLR